ncbi:ferredoxin [Nocardiopsis sp. NPDC050513]|uniref:ferredoxin n=1 Tax=Nocardiopsis sp. NPDC050513 TaxID=3364338 RepID=UPI0037A82F8C
MAANTRRAGPVGAGRCALIAPEVFDQREEDGVVVLLDAEPEASLSPAVHESAQVCPAAIRLDTSS